MTARDDKRGEETPSPQNFAGRLRGSAAFLASNYNDLSSSEAQVIVKALESAADHVEAYLASAPSHVEPKSTEQHNRDMRIRTWNAKAAVASGEMTREQAKDSLASVPSTTPFKTLDDVPRYYICVTSDPAVKFDYPVEGNTGFVESKDGAWMRTHDAMKAFAASATPRKWIPVSERLPHTHSVLGCVVASDDFYVRPYDPMLDICTYFPEDGEWRISLGDSEVKVKVSHWMPLPEKPNNSPDGGKQT